MSILPSLHRHFSFHVRVRKGYLHVKRYPFTGQRETASTVIRWTWNEMRSKGGKLMPIPRMSHVVVFCEFQHFSKLKKLNTSLEET
jgi:hypothetical protein